MQDDRIGADSNSNRDQKEKRKNANLKEERERVNAIASWLSHHDMILIEGKAHFHPFLGQARLVSVA